MKHVKLFEQFIATLTEGVASSMLSKLGKGVEHETVASMMDQDEEVSKEIIAAMKKLGCSAEECGVIGDYHTDNWNKVLKVAKSSGVEFIEVKDDNGSAIVFSLNEAKLNENTIYGRKFHLMFPDGSYKTYDANALEFIRQKDSLAEANKIVLKRAYTESKPAITAGKIAAVRNKMLEAVKDGKMSQDQFNTILKEYSKDTGRWMKRNAKFFNVSEEGVSLSKYGKKALSQITINEDGEVEEGRAFVAAAKKAKEEGKEEFEFDGNKFPVTIKEGNAFIYAAAKAKRDGKKEFEFNGKTYKVTLKADTNLKESKGFIYESFSEFIESLDEKNIINEAFKSAKLASILTGANQMPKDLAAAFYGMSKLALDQIEDVDIIEMDPQTAKKEKRNSAVYLYFTTNEKENTFAKGTSNIIIPANTLLAITDGKNEWMNTTWAGYKGARYQTLSVTKRDDSAGIQKSSANTGWGTGISSMKQVVELADRAYCLDLDVLRARYSTANKRDERAAAKSGAIAFKSDKDFKAENMARYHNILANRAVEMPLDREVMEAIDIVTQQIKDGLSAGKKGRYNDIIIGTSPKGQEVKLKDAAYVMSNLLDDFNKYVDYTNSAEKEKEAGYSDSYYEREVKNYAKQIVDRIKKIKELDYAW